MLATWKMSPELNALQCVIKIINHIKVHALNSCRLTQLSEEMNAEHTHLLLHTEVRWLYKGRSLARVFELWEMLHRFLLEKQSPLAAHISDAEWVVKLAYLCDIFNLLNELNLLVQGRMTTVFKSADKVAALGFFLIYLLIMLLQLSHSPPSLHSILHTPSLPHSPPIFHVHGSYI